MTSTTSSSSEPRAYPPLEIHLFTNYEGDRQVSMLRYSNSLQAGLKQYAGAICTSQTFAPRYGGKRSSPWVSRWKRYIEYPLLARRHSGQINHITDHGNSHLVNYLPRDRTIITCHDLNTLKLSHLPGAPSKRYVFSFWSKVKQMKKAACVITDSESNRQDIVSYIGIPQDKIHVVYLGVDHERFRPLESHESKEFLRRKYNFSWPLTIFHVGSATFYKNVEGIIETLSRLRQTHHLDVHFVRVGPPLTLLQQAFVEKRGMQNHVHTLSAKTDEVLRELYLASDVLLFPSWGEGFGLPPLEAFCCGTPVVVSNLPAIIEGTGTAALQVPPEDPEAMALAVVRVVEDTSLRARMREDGIAQAAKFSWKNTAEGTARVYQKFWTSCR